MKVELVAFGVLEIEGTRYDTDVVIDAGGISRRKKGPSKPLRDRYGHTPLTARERIPWGPGPLVIGTGADGALPIAPDLVDEARRRGVELVILPTREACRRLVDVEPSEVHAILHGTC